jgi:hypothetical protein
MTRQPAADVLLTMVSDTYIDAIRRGFYSAADLTLKGLLSSQDVRTLLVADHPRSLNRPRGHHVQPLARRARTSP